MLVLGQGRTGQIPRPRAAAGRARLRRRAEHHVARLRPPAERRVLHAARARGAAAALRRAVRARDADRLRARRGSRGRHSGGDQRAGARAARARLPRADQLGRLHQPRADQRPGGAAPRLRVPREAVSRLPRVHHGRRRAGRSQRGQPRPRRQAGVGSRGRQGRLPVLRREGDRRERPRQPEGLRPPAERPSRRAVRAGGHARASSRTCSSGATRTPSHVLDDASGPARPAAQDQRRRAAAAGEDLLRLAVAGRLGGRRRAGAGRQRQRRRASTRTASPTRTAGCSPRPRSCTTAATPR